jgi:hypothetical protein
MERGEWNVVCGLVETHLGLNTLNRHQNNHAGVSDPDRTRLSLINYKPPVTLYTSYLIAPMVEKHERISHIRSVVSGI